MMKMRRRVMISNRKNILALFCAALCLLSCGKEILPRETGAPGSADPSARVEYHISASCTGTKTEFAGSDIVWSEGDRIAVSYKHLKKQETAVFEYEGNESFKAEILTPDSPCDWFAVYPSSAAGSDGTCVRIPAESVQTGNSSKAHLAGEGFPLFGKALSVSGKDVPHLQMEQVAAAINFNITNGDDRNIKVTKVIFTAPVEIAGEFTGTLASDGKWIPANGKATKTAVLNVEKGTDIAPGASASFYMGVMPFEATGDFSITVMAERSGEEIYSYKEVKGRTMGFEAGVVGKINYSFTDSMKGAATSYYVKVTTDPGATKWSGTYLIVNTGNSYALSTTGRKTGTVAVNVIGGSRIEATPELDKCALSISGGTSTHVKGASGTYGYDLINSDGDYVFWNSSGWNINSTNRADNDNPYQHTIVLSNSQVQLMSAKNSSYGGNKYYLTYSGGSFSYNNTSGNRVLLYKKDGTATKAGQTLQFASSRVTWNVGDDGDHITGSTYNLPQLASGAKTFVSYSSSNEEVAEVIGNSQIKINAPGTTTITATAAESSEYSAASASFTLSVKLPAMMPETDLGTFELVNDYMRNYLERAAKEYKADGSDWSTKSIVTEFNAGSNSTSYDRPLPVSIPVDEANGSKVTVVVYNDSARAEVEMEREYTVTNGKAEVYNLIPNSTYWYTVVAGGEDISQGTFKTTGLRRLLNVSSLLSNDHANNLRDFGGQKTENGGTLRYNLIFRGTNMDGTTKEEQDWIINYMGVRRDIDLRSKGGSSSSYAHQSLPSPVEYTNGNISTYQDINNAKMQLIFGDIAKTVSKGDACYIHCYVGADRTGYICMLLNAICGVSKRDCTIDYEMTSFSCVGRRARNKSNFDYNTEGMKLIESKSGSTFQEKAINTLRGYQIPDDTINAIIKAMVEPAK